MTGKIFDILAHPKSIAEGNPRLFGLEKIAQKRSEVAGFYRTTIVSALTLAAALFWNNAITSLLNAYFSKDQSVVGQFIAAALVTLVVAVLIIKLKNNSEMPEKA